MTTLDPEITGLVSGKTVEPLLVRPAEAWKMLGCGNTYGYELINTRQLDSFLDGKARKITVASIHRYIARKLGAATITEAAPQPRRRGRPRKVPLQPANGATP